MRTQILPILPLFGALLCSPAMAEAPLPPPMIDEEVIPQLDADTLEAMEGEVRIIRRGDDVIEEFRVAGRLYMVRITPAKGRPYYLIDSDGNGILDTRREALDPPSVVKWRIFSW